MRLFRALVLLLVGVAIFVGLQQRIAPLPPLGPFLNPFSGYLQNGEDAPPPETLNLPALQDEATIVWDDRRVPHVFAKNDHDLYFTQGYLTARDRLWQMDIQVLAAAGRLAEILGPSMVEHDRFQRRIGIPRAAELTAEAMEQVELSRPVVDAYTDGVNAYIAKLGYADLPLEYKLLDYRPEPWSAYRSALLLKQMAWDLTTYNMNEVNLTRVREQFGQEDVDKLYPIFPPYTQPVIPAGTKWPFKAPVLPPTSQDRSLGLLDRTPPNVSQGDDEEPALGSNNWAISGSRTLSGAPILCNDPHLSLTLPAVWYESQLNSPTVNVYGVTLPGAPGVVIGFNEHVAWGLTNAETDVIDWEEVQLPDTITYSPYPFLPRIGAYVFDTILVRDSDPVIDVALWIGNGAVVRREGEEAYNPRVPTNSILRWTGSPPSQELIAFLKLSRAQNYDDDTSALQHYNAPAQNFAFACDEGDIAIVHNGAIPVRLEGDGRFVGTEPITWFGPIPRHELPQIKNPERGFVSSANQCPVDSLYPYYLNGTYFSFERGARINEILDTMTAATPEDMMILQTDVLNIQARKVLPTLLSMIKIDSLNDLESQLFQELSDWDYRELAEMRTPTVYHTWWRQLSHAIWDDEMRSPWGPLDPPREDVTTQLILEESDSPFFDNVKTKGVENLSYLVNSSYRDAVAALFEDLSAPGPRWRWGRYRGTDIMHLAALPALSRMNLQTGGSSLTVDAGGIHTGPSWRMIVELTNPPQAWGVYPGGQTGNPGSKYYDSQVDKWLSGDYYKLHFLSAPDSDFEGYLSTTTVRGNK